MTSMLEITRVSASWLRYRGKVDHEGDLAFVAFLRGLDEDELVWWASTVKMFPNPHLLFESVSRRSTAELPLLNPVRPLLGGFVTAAAVDVTVVFSSVNDIVPVLRALLGTPHADRDDLYRRIGHLPIFLESKPTDLGTVAGLLGDA